MFVIGLSLWCIWVGRYH